MEHKNTENKKKTNIFKKLSSEFRKIRWTNWKVTKKSFLVTVFSLTIMSLLFFGITTGLIELFKSLGIL